MDMVEKVARAIHAALEKERSGGVFVGDFYQNCTRLDGEFDLVDLARAAIEAMREPTREMVAAAWYDFKDSPSGALVEESSVGRSPNDLKLDTAYEVWQAMIDAAVPRSLNADTLVDVLAEMRSDEGFAIKPTQAILPKVK